MGEVTTTLQQRLETEGRLPLGGGLALLDELLRVIGESHRDGACDGALTPARVGITDAGMPVVLGADTPAPADAAAYRSPQQRDGDAADARADVYALGVIAYRTLTGEMPFAPGADAPTDPVGYLPGLNDTVRRTLLIAMQRNLTERFADALTMRAALRGDSQVALDTPTIRWAVPEGIPEGDTGAADEYANEPGLLDEDSAGPAGTESP